MTKLTYTRNGDYLIPDIKLANTESLGHSKYARMRETYLKENAPILYNDLVLTEQLFLHLKEISETAKARMELMMEQLLEKYPAPDKKTQQMAWVQHMNTLKAQAEEFVCAELIYK